MRLLKCLSVLFVLGGSAAHAACGTITANVSGGGSLGSYDPFSFPGISQARTITVTNDASALCNLTAVLTHPTPAATTDASGTITFGATFAGVNEFGVDIEPPTATPSNAASDAKLSFTVTDSETITFHATVETSQFSTSNTVPIDQPIVIRFFDGATEVATVDFSPSISVIESISISLSGVNAMGELDFGALSPGQTRPAFLIVRSTRNYRFDVTSLYSGVLRHDTDVNSTIPYTVSVQDSPRTFSRDALSLASPLRFNRPATDDAAGDNYDVTIRIEDFSDRRAGDYSDEIEVVVTTRP